MAIPEKLQVKVHVVDGVLVPDNPVDLPRGRSYLATLEPLPDVAPIDALAEIVALAQSIGPVDLAREFDRHTKRVLDDESTP